MLHLSTPSYSVTILDEYLVLFPQIFFRFLEPMPDWCFVLLTARF